jgi:hypothetical protein
VSADAAESNDNTYIFGGKHAIKARLKLKTSPRSTAPHRTAPHRTAPHARSQRNGILNSDEKLNNKLNSDSVLKLF